MARKLQVEIVGDASSYQRALGQAGKASQTFGQKVQRGALIAGTALSAGLAVGAKIGFDELAEGQKVAAQTNAALKSTGGIANVTARDIEGLAQAQSELTGIDDELIQSGENLLLTFKNVRNEVGAGNAVFDRATKAALDLSTAGFGSVESASKMMGKALNDPIKGMTALGRAGVTFSAEQKQTIKDLVATGHTLEAQRLILKEVESQVGGSAKAYGETLPGQLNKAKNAFEGMAAGLVVVLLPAVLAVSGGIAKLAAYLTEHEGVAKAVGVALVALAGTLLAVGVATKLYAAGQAIVTAATVAWTAVQWALNAALTANPIGIVVVALAALVAGLILAYKNSETFRRIVEAAFTAVKAAGQAVLNFFRDNWKIIATLISGPFLPIVALATDAFGIRSKLIAAANAILDFFRSNWKTIATIISGPFAPLVALATNAFGIRSALIGAFGDIVTGIREKVAAAVEVVRGIPGRFKSALGDLGGLLYNAGVQIIQGLINGINDKLEDLWGVVSGIGGKIKGLKGPIAEDRQLLQPEGAAIIEGLIAGVKSALPELDRTMSGIGPSLTIGDTTAADGMAKSLEDQQTQWLTIRTSQQQQRLAQEKTWQTQIVEMIASFVPDFYAAGKALGEGLATGLLDSRGKVVDAANELAQAVASALNVSTDLRRQAVGDIEARTSQLGQRIPMMAAGGVVTVPTLALIGEGGPEAVIPLAQMGGMGGIGGGITVNVYGSVTSERDLAETLRVELMRTGRFNAGGVLGGLA